MIWKTNTREFDLSSRALVMGILNVTEDSFSDGGQFCDPEAAAAHAFELEAEGADIIDIGGESTRPGARAVPEAEELARVVPVLEKLAGRLKAAISIDTTKAAVARAAMERGAEIINDVSALLGDPEMPRTAAETKAGVVLMHFRGTPRTMQLAPHYEDVVAEVREFFRQNWRHALRSGIDPERVVFDPGIGFGKTVEHNLELLRHLGDLGLEEAPRPLLLGVSRKSFLSIIIKNMAIEERIWPTVAITSLGRERGVRIFRVHDVKASVEALRMTEAILGEC
jgi:dihydropteroate synthase